MNLKINNNKKKTTFLFLNRKRFNFYFNSKNSFSTDDLLASPSIILGSYSSATRPESCRRPSKKENCHAREDFFLFFFFLHSDILENFFSEQCAPFSQEEIWRPKGSRTRNQKDPFRKNKDLVSETVRTVWLRK